jgi:hypothetical protein
MLSVLGNSGKGYQLIGCPKLFTNYHKRWQSKKSSDDAQAPYRLQPDAGHIYGRFGLYSGRRIEIQLPTVEVDRIDEVLFIPESAGGVLHPLDLRIERFAGRVGNRVA